MFQFHLTTALPFADIILPKHFWIDSEIGALGLPGIKKTMTVYLLRLLNQCWMFVGSQFINVEMSSLSSYFAWNKFLNVSLMKNLLWNVRHIAAMMFFFEKFFVSMLCSALVSNPKSRILKIFSLFVCFQTNRLCQEQDRIVSILF